MQRRDFIKNTVLTTGAIAFGSCKEKDPYAEREYKGQIAIIGAGAAGLYAGYLLEEKKANYVIYEASDQIGGRIRSLKGFADFDIELGAEKIYGDRSVWYDWAKESGASFIPNNTTDFYQVGSQLLSESQAGSNNDVKAALAVAQQALNYTGADMTLLQLMESAKLAPGVRYITEALVAAKNGTSANRLSVLGVAEQRLARSAGEGEFSLANRSLSAVLEEKCKNVIPKVVLNTQIKRIDYSNQRIMLEDAQAQRRYVDKVILTVPLSVLQSTDLQFTPALPDTKIASIKGIGMGTGIKVVLVFNQRFWDASADSIYTAGVVPEYSASSNGRSTKSFVLTGTVMGEKAEALSALSTSAAIQSLLKDLDGLYGKGVAMGSLTNARLMDWGKDPFIKGAYSYPIVGGGGLLNRQTLSAPVQRRLYFAGEATHYGGHSGTVHGAMESGRRVVEELYRDVT
ncbi:flavin monoamine oxidase family protein [Runella slithyformis]|uniref:Tryptophan 2-monooxygenase n=1 Tax=Runella slithyformis (strain ATCC 29530 / DSM 19594 / LMG 11500 / NCIMB 11436 / LSU 4) TaxID=761193 RepID=A0A7U4E6D5_RUNSL|nr:NAD(P)/FAD-dependent oxidoreductase [Runella slithyformis]AEI49428.1 amine oxidase [Runella slithyformis DSM 19594]